VCCCLQSCFRCATATLCRDLQPHALCATHPSALLTTTTSCPTANCRDSSAAGKLLLSCRRHTRVAVPLLGVCHAVMPVVIAMGVAIAVVPGITLMLLHRTGAAPCCVITVAMSIAPKPGSAMRCRCVGYHCTAACPAWPSCCCVSCRGRARCSGAKGVCVTGNCCVSVVAVMPPPHGRATGRRCVHVAGHR